MALRKRLDDAVTRETRYGLRSAKNECRNGLTRVNSGFSRIVFQPERRFFIR